MNVICGVTLLSRTDFSSVSLFFLSLYLVIHVRFSFCYSLFFSLLWSGRIQHNTRFNVHAVFLFQYLFLSILFFCAFRTLFTTTYFSFLFLSCSFSPLSLFLPLPLLLSFSFFHHVFSLSPSLSNLNELY